MLFCHYRAPCRRYLAGALTSTSAYQSRITTPLIHMWSNSSGRIASCSSLHFKSGSESMSIQRLFYAFSRNLSILGYETMQLPVAPANRCSSVDLPLETPSNIPGPHWTWLLKTLQEWLTTWLQNVQVLFVCESIKLGEKSLDAASKMTFVSALSREEVRKGRLTEAREVYLVSAAQIGVRRCLVLHADA
jgi:hypothetical protein